MHKTGGKNKKEEETVGKEDDFLKVETLYKKFYNAKTSFIDVIKLNKSDRRKIGGKIHITKHWKYKKKVSHNKIPGSAGFKADF